MSTPADTHNALNILSEIEELKQHYYSICYDAFQNATTGKKLVRCLMLVNRIHPLRIYITNRVLYRHIATCLPDDAADKCIPSHLREVIDGHLHLNFDQYISAQTYKLITDNMESYYWTDDNDDDYTLAMLMRDVNA